MLELSLHLLDIFENSLRAGASTVRFSIRIDASQNLMTLCVEDDGPGLPVRPDQALDPFYTTKSGKRTGLGLSLFQAAAQQADGALTLDDSEWGGVRVTATFIYNHIDRAPLGDVAASIMTLLMSNPDLRFICIIDGPRECRELDTRLLRDAHPQLSSFALLRQYCSAVKEALNEAEKQARED